MSSCYGARSQSLPRVMAKSRVGGGREEPCGFFGADFCADFGQQDRRESDKKSSKKNPQKHPPQNPHQILLRIFAIQSSIGLKTSWVHPGCPCIG